MVSPSLMGSLAFVVPHVFPSIPHAYLVPSQVYHQRFLDGHLLVTSYEDAIGVSEQDRG